MRRLRRQGIVYGVSLGALAGATGYGFILWYAADRNSVLCNPGYAGTLPVLLSIPTFLLIAAAAGYLASDGKSVWPALAAGVLVGALASVGNFATVHMLQDQLVRMYGCPSDPNAIGPSLEELKSSTLTSAIVGSAIGLVLAPVAAAGGHVIKRDRRQRRPSPTLPTA